MPNFLENLRLRNIFGPPGPTPFQNINFGPQVDFTQPPAPAPTPQPSQGYYDPGFDVTQRMQELYTPETAASERFNELLAAQPKREEYKPSFLRRIGSALTAFGPGGMEQGMELLYRPFTEKQETWKGAITPAQRAAELERQQNINERTLAYQTVTQELAQRRDEARARGQEEQARLLEQRIGKMMSDFEKITLQQQGRIAGIQEAGEQTRLTEEARQPGREALAETRGWTTANIPDPNDPTGQKMIGVRINQVTGETVPITFKGQEAGPVSRPGAPGAGKQPVNIQAIQDKTRETLSALNEILDEKGKLRPEAASAVGGSRMFGLQYLPATQTRAGDVAIKRLKSMLVVDLIGEMKAQSRTGATGFGQLNLRELAVLENAASKLDPALDEATFTKELNRIRERLTKVLQPADGFEEVKTPAPSKPMTADDYIKKYGGG